MQFRKMIQFTERDGMIVFKVQVVPRAARSEIVGEHDGAVRVRIAAPPVDGAANEELIRLIAKTVGVSRKDVEITSGQASRNKLVRIRGRSREALEQRLVKS